MKQHTRVLGTGLVGFLAVGICMILLGISTNTEAQTTALPNCPVSLATNVTSGASLTGITPLQLYVPTVNTSFTIDKVIFRVDGRPVGYGRPSMTTASSWAMSWPTQLIAPGAHQFNVQIFYNQTAQCQTPLIPINVTPPTTTINATFGVDVSPPQWSGVTNTTIDIVTNPVTNTGLVSTELNQHVVYIWETNIGTVMPMMSNVRYASGASAGSGRVLMKAYFGGREVIREIPIQVYSQLTAPPPSPTPSPAPTTTTTDSTSPTNTSTTTDTTVREPLATTTEPLSTEQKIELIARQIDSQPAVLTCATQNLTQERIDALRAEGRRLTREEFARMRGCFSQTNYVVPASYAPVEPTEVKTTVAQTTSARIKDMKTEALSTSDGVTQAILRFEGQAEPNSDVLLYVFSEPLVLYAKADDKGNWVYDLVDPMEPGDHEAYAVVESSDGTYRRSSAFSFLIETAQASSENPNGYSLSVQTVGTLNPPASRERLNLYMVASAVVVVLVLVVGGFIMQRTLKHIPDDQSGGGHGYGN